ncbi:rolling circle replication-associated protein [Pelagicoccus mobilis]|uniref:Replication-associated protein ORF2/G2P domain-containing protein n=1 Tax=Pelagicoccus mobilis TaxID=415221 RepID=A0A934RUD6_9BACT|nr:hypothetical protein [Pelagicoccus mobilis]MBK1875595.1 hypothetical protein [Pelagicoccus mobilis]
MSPAVSLFDEKDARVEVEITDDRSNAQAIGELSPYVPRSWFCPVGIRKVLADLEPRLPDVGGCLFLTFTVDPKLFSEPEAAFDKARDKLRRIFHKLRRGVKWEGKQYKVDKPYCVKLEFHENGWPHFHSIFLSKRFLPGGLLNKLWNYGRTNVARISNEDFRYLLKYVTKSGEIPEWVRGRERIRIFQASRGFYRKRTKPPSAKKKNAKGGSDRKTKTTIGERLKIWEKTAVLKDQLKRYKQIKLNQPYSEMAGKEALSAAKEGRYLGNARFCINNPKQLENYIL